ncbi:MAG TPA: TetR/AcrR family transcriptional regulator [Solirubrobacteraceae bacterium]|nr:TetR/AcrR family transcriptional regulator [Solirubrobacteraceae bacterium]
MPPGASDDDRRSPGRDAVRGAVEASRDALHATRSAFDATPDAVETVRDVHDTVRARRRSTRDRPAKAPLSEEVIVDTALEILRAEGLDAVTMRRVAAELDTGPASLYVYIRGRDELRAAMLDRVSALVPLEQPDPDLWREQVHLLLTRLLRALDAHPGIAQVAVANVPTTDRAMDFAENMVALLRAGGIDSRDAAWACDILPLIVTATAVETATYQARAAGGHRPEDETVARLMSAFAALSPERYPQLTAHAEEMVSGDGDERFAFAIDTFLDGLVARSARR